MADFYEQVKTCPVCEKSFPVMRVKSSASAIISRESDYNIKYRGVNPIYYSIWVCPNCHFACLDSIFEEPLTSLELERLKKGLPLFKSDNEPNFSVERPTEVAIRTYALAIRSAQIRQQSSGAQAGLYLRISWLYRELENHEAETEYTEKALQLYTHAFGNERGRVGKMSEAGTMYLIGELNRRVGNYKDSITWFSRCISAPGIKMEPQVEKMARDQWDLAKQEAKNNPEGTPQKSEKESTENKEGTLQKTGSSTKSSNSETTAQISVQSTTTATATISSRTSSLARTKSKMFVSLYNDQIEWLKKVADKGSSNGNASIEKEAVLRAIVDAVKDLNLDLTTFKSEEELRDLIVKTINHS